MYMRFTNQSYLIGSGVLRISDLKEMDNNRVKDWLAGFETRDKEPGTKKNADKLYVPTGSQLSKITEQFVKFLSVDYPQSRAVGYKKLLAEDFSFSKKRRDRSKSSSKPAKSTPATSTRSPQDAGPSGRVILTFLI